MTELTPFPTAFLRLVKAGPDAPAVSDARGTVSRADLDRRSNSVARAYAELGVRPGDIVSLALPSDRRFVEAALAVWKLGATPQPLSPRIAPAEMQAILDVTRPSLVVGHDAGPGLPWLGIEEDLSAAHDDSPLPAAVSPSWKAPTSGGSTGQPKVILSTSPAVAEPLLGLAAAVRLRGDDVYLTPAPLHHNGPFLTATAALLAGAHIVLMERFDAERMLDLVERFRTTWVYAVPTVMSRIAKLPEHETARRDLSSIRTLVHMAAPCAPWLKRWWIDRLGADAVWEVYAGTEAQTITLIGGSDWLTHPGSVGRPLTGELRILDADGNDLPAGQVGEVYMRAAGGVETYRYLGGTAKSRDGWESLGDLGHLDDQGYLYLADRLTDMVLVGGVNVYPAEVEAALESHPDVLSSCVVGLPDDDLGNRLHAVVQTSRDVPDDVLHTLLAERLAPHKQPRTIERVDYPLRDEAGKIRRSSVRDARLAVPV
ncbi:MAG: AMP-binding protein [Actinobacteria bacterium]|nr:AMP-binding protein [Actinomycetota bacterium]